MNEEDRDRILREHQETVARRRGERSSGRESIFVDQATGDRAFTESNQSRDPLFQSGASLSLQSEIEREAAVDSVRRQRYEQILAKEKWTFNGAPLHGTIVGFGNGIVRIQLKGAPPTEPPIERMARRFSPTDISDIIFYARYHGIPIGNLKK